jgi:hypothetical protein
VPCLILRSTTEWSELVAASDGRMVLIGLDLEAARAAVARLAPAIVTASTVAARIAGMRLEPAGAAEAISATLAAAEGTA